MLPWSDLVHLKSKMSEARRSQRLQATDFSIARILATDNPSSSSSFSSSGSSGSSNRLEISETRVPKSPTIPSCSCCPLIILPTISNPERNKFLPIKERRSSSADEGLENSNRVEKQLPETCGPSSESEKISGRTSDSNKWQRDNSEGNNDLPWLHCTRYRPPRLPKRSAGKISKRKPGKHPRIPFTAFQLQILEDKYSKGAYLARRDVVQLSLILRLPQSRVKIWFQNRRARERRESVQLENDTDTNCDTNILKVD